MNLTIRYNPDTVATEVFNGKGVLLISVGDEVLRSNKLACKALDDLIELGAGGPKGTTLVEESSKTHAMVKKMQQLMEGKKKKR